MVMGPNDGTAGTQYQHATITNNGQQSCTLTGYPTAVLLDDLGLQLGSAALANTHYTPQTITLAPHKKAHALIGFPDVGNFDPHVCSDISSKLKLTLPGSSEFLTTAIAKNSCPGFSVSALQPGL
jgi:hypothetical protein